MKVIAATDFSPNATDAARGAARLARKLGDSVILLRVIDPPSAMYPELGLVAPEILASLRDAAERDLAKLKGLLAGEGVSIETRILVGSPAQTIVKLAEDEAARLVVVGSHGRGAAARFFWGSVADRTVQRAKCPVLVLREGSAPFDMWVDGTRALRIVVGVDRGPGTQAALAWIRELRKAGRCDVTMVHEYWPPAEYSRLGLRPPGDLLKTDPEVVAVLERELRSSGVHLENDGRGEAKLIIQAAWGRTVDSLAMVTDAEKADVLVVGTRQLNGWQRLKEGSTTLGTLHATQIPVFSVPVASLKEPAQHEEPVLRSVLVATDFSEAGNAAVAHAYGLLRGRGGTVEICTIVERHLPAPVFAYDDREEPVAPEPRARLETALRGLVPDDAARQGIKTNVHVIGRGLTAQAILQAAERLGVDAIVLGSEGRTGIGRALLGSVAESVMRGSERPVYIVRQQAAGP
jgi:nucleotide-binding universal stress UspA family protein